jgi:predicted amino acid-binding ACT domain protein
MHRADNLAAICEPIVQQCGIHNISQPYRPSRYITVIVFVTSKRRSQWRNSLRFELSSPAQVLRLWVQIPHEAYMFMCLFCVYIVLRVGRGLTSG